MVALKLAVRIISIVIFTLFAFSILPSRILGIESGIATETEILKIFVGETKVVSTRSPTRIIVANPSIADIAEVTNTEIRLQGKSVGTTTLVFWDAFGEQSLKIRVIQEDVQEIKRRVDNMLAKLGLQDITTQAEEEEGKVVILGQVTSATDKERINTALGPLKEKTIDLVQLKESETVVEIDVQVLELDKDASKELGFTWPSSVAIATDAPADGNTWVLDPTNTTAAMSRWSTFFRIKQWSRTNFYWRLDLLQQEGKARILSRPRLACVSGKEAELMVGGEKPVFTTSTSSEGGISSTTVEYKEFGIKLKVQPEVTEEERIKLSVKVEVSEVGQVETIGSTSSSVTSITGQAYPLIKRNASTVVFVSDGETLAIGGLMKQKTTEELKKFPWLADLPVLGAFFRKKTTTEGGGFGERGNTELYITITPTIISTKTSSKKQAPAPLPQEEISSPPVPAHLQNYVNAIRTKINNAVFFPQAALEAGWEGRVILNLNLTATGELKGITVAKSSGYKILDDAAKEAAIKQSPYPPFPPQVSSRELTVDVPILFKKN